MTNATNKLHPFEIKELTREQAKQIGDYLNSPEGQKKLKRIGRDMAFKLSDVRAIK